MEIPAELIFEGSTIEIYFAQNRFFNRTANAVVFEGNRHGFLSLANCLIYFVNALEDEIKLSSVPFIRCQIGVTIKIDESVAETECGVVSRKDDQNFIWAMSDAESNDIFTAFHSLGHINSELHLDNGKATEDLSVYCVVS